MTRMRGIAGKAVLGGGIALAAVAGAFLVLRLLPFFLEPYLAEKLRREGVEVKTLSLETVGLTGTFAGKGTVRRGVIGLDWDSLALRYNPAGLVGGELDSILVGGPGVTVTLPDREARPPVPAESLPDGRPAEGTGVDPELPASPTGEDPGSLPGPGTVVPARPDFVRLLQDLPVRERIAVERGRLGFDFPGGESLVFQWNGSLRRGLDALEGAFHLEGEGVTVEAFLRSPRASPSLNLVSTFEARPERILGTFLDWFDFDPSGGNRLEFGEQATLGGDVLLDAGEAGDLRLSLETELKTFQVRGGPFGEGFVLERLLLVGTGSREAFRVQGGADLGALRRNGVSVDPFSLEFDLDPEGELSFETGKIGLRHGGVSATFAARGQGQLASLAGGIPPRTEISITEGGLETFRVEPFSLLLEGDADTVGLRASPVGLKKAGTLWIEDLKADYRREAGTVSSGFQWFSSAGAPMGSVRAGAEAIAGGGWRAEVQLDDGEAEGRFKARGTYSGDGGKVEGEGRLPLAWLNALNRWGDFLPASLSGRDPVLETAMTFAPTGLKGRLRLGIEGLNASLGSDASLEGIRGEGRFEVNLLPRTEGWQALHVERIDTGGIVLAGFSMEWALPSINRLQFREIGADLGGGRMTAAPFSLNPLDPEFGTHLTFSGIEGDAFLEWLGEERFAISGTVSGSIRLRWREGVLQVGSGELRMDPADSPEDGNRFLFSDEAFLEEQFAAMGGVPEAIRTRFLAALLEEGILIENLQVRLVPLPEEAEVTLRVILKGRTRTEDLDVPIEQLVINNVIPEADLGRLLGLMGPVEVVDLP